MVRRILVAVALLCTGALPASAQFSLVEGLFKSVSDIAFYVGSARAAPSSAALEAHRGVSSFGIELLFPVAVSTRERQGGPTAAAGRRLTQIEVTVSGGRSDTTYTYVPTTGGSAALDTIWSYELAVGYGQISDIELKDETLDLNVTVRELPAVTFYLSHEPSGLYAGIRSGLLQTYGLQLYEEDGSATGGSAQAFQFGVALGFARTVGKTFPFIETSYMHREFPSIEWKTSPLPAAVPRELDLSGLQLLLGVQIPLRK